jgi:hypothetical protein
MILFCLRKKTGVSASIFTTGYKLTFNPILRRILVNLIMVYQEAVKFRSLSVLILVNSKGVMIMFLVEKKAGVSSSLFTTRNKLTFNRVLRRILVNQISVYHKAVKF